MTCERKVVYNYQKEKCMEEIKVEKQKSSTLAKFGNFFFVLAIICVVACCLAFATVIIMPIIWLLGFFLIIITIGFIFAIIPGYWSKLNGLANAMDKVADLFLKIGPYVAGVGITLGVGAIVCLALDKSKKHTGKIIAVSITTAVLIAGLVLILIYR